MQVYALKYGNIYRKQLKIGEMVNFFCKIYHNFHIKYLKSRLNTDTPKKTYKHYTEGKEEIYIIAVDR